ncbi:universal stress protein [Methylibium sp.]|nr:universal stress protein [Methylibium sp.]MBA3591449.1 universal stress protein [Methylibium sp.]
MTIVTERRASPLFRCLTPISGLVLGSVATRVLHLARVPVVVVK